MKYNAGDGIIKVYGQAGDIRGYLVFVKNKNGMWGRVGDLYQTESEARDYYKKHFDGVLDPIITTRHTEFPRD